MNGWTGIDWWYFLFATRRRCRSMPYFGVRVNSPGSPNSASSTALVLFTASPMPTAMTIGRYFSARLPVRVRLALRKRVEIEHRHRRRRKQRHVDQQHLRPAHVVADDHRRKHQDRQDDHQQVVEVRRQVEERLDLDLHRQIRLQEVRQHLAAGLDRPLGPAVLLRLEGVHLDRHFRRRDDVGQEQELPAAQLRAVAEVEILGQRVVLPAAAHRRWRCGARGPPSR